MAKTLSSIPWQCILSSLSKGPAILRSKQSILPGHWYEVYVKRRLRDAVMTLTKVKVATLGDDVMEEEVRGTAPGSTRGLNVRTHLYFGGIDREFLVRLCVYRSCTVKL